MKTGKIKQKIIFKAGVSDVFDLLLNKKKYSAFTGGDVFVSKSKNGKFSVFDGYCTGYNISIVTDKEIVQAWNFKEDGWPEDHFSICKFLFKKTTLGTELIFTQEGIPFHKIKALKEGWKDYFWQPMKEYLKNNKK
jgi:activator of HSP90 ATPase